MTDAELVRHIARVGYSIWEDPTGETAKQLMHAALRLEKDEPPPIPQSGK